MLRLHRLAAAAESAVIDLLLVRPRVPLCVRRSRWIIARCALFAALAAMTLTALLVHLGSLPAIAG